MHVGNLSKVINITSASVSLQIGMMTSKHQNGIIRFYQIRYRSRDWQENITTTTTPELVHPNSSWTFWNMMHGIMMNCSNVTEPQPDSTALTNHTIEGLRPYTNYELNISACTSVGCGEVRSDNESAADIYVRTEPSLPSCSPNITMTNTSSTSLLLSWKPVDRTCLHGQLISYHVYRF